MTETESTTTSERSESESKREESEQTNAVDEQHGQGDRHARHETPEKAGRTNPSRDPSPRKYLYQGALVVLVLLAVVALFQFYMSALDVIWTFVADRYRPLFNAAFNLVVLLAAGIGISFTVRSMD
ncbi:MULTISPECIES: hypothetical protein [unclassified Haladaptatus]|uniref:hypothetical protein n=1 Tax=unclassified Haladaptatus TaxID=2622732 RepID=UPI00209BE131|nr:MULTISPECIES: hypothetical protein [unclassified Haladaptatus]MCO8243111.1 hypothetical protein [Haladaptatus sp. AB643]MCO8252825.1 hypothetical protein [Haladaptatus sp. AB618]